MAERPPHPGDDRTPPHSIEAEEAALGAALISPDAAHHLAATCEPADYYRPQHRHIAQAIRNLVNADQPVDAVTVSDELRRRGTLDDAGGIQTLSVLQAATPAVSAAPSYARIIRSHAIRRRIIYASGDLAALGYDTDDPAEALVRASELIAKLGGADLAEVSALEVADIAELLAGDLEPEEATILHTSAGRNLIYSGKMHSLSGEPEAGKSWVALAACAQVIDAGGAALYIDYEDTSRGVLQRLLALGVDPDDATESFGYVQPVGPITEAERASIYREIDRLNPDLIVIDSVGESVSTNGLSEDQAPDIITWANLLPRPLARTGAAVVMLDHVTKDPEHRGRWARGSGAKLGIIDGAAFQVKSVSPFSRNVAGRSHLVMAKDRPGGVGPRGETVAVVGFDPFGGGERMVIDLDPYTEEMRTGDSFKPTHYMADVARLLADSAQPLTGSGIKAALPGRKRRLVETAIARLVAEGHITKGTGTNAGYSLVRPYVDPEARHDVPPPHDDDDAPPDELDLE